MPAPEETLAEWASNTLHSEGAYPNRDTKDFTALAGFAAAGMIPADANLQPQQSAEKMNAWLNILSRLANFLRDEGSLGHCGDGSNSDVVIASDTDLAGPMFYNNLTINAGIQLNTNSCFVGVRGTLTFGSATSRIHADANGILGGGASGGPGTRQLGTGGAGGLGQTGLGQDPLISLDPAFGGVGGNGGAGSSGGGGNGSLNFTALNETLRGAIRTLPQLTTGHVMGAGGILQLQGGQGGGGGGGDGTNNGGNGGGGGGVCVVAANNIVGPGIISANGAAGFDGTGGNSGGGGGGGGGAVLLLTRAQASLTLEALAGAFGAGVGTGANGTAGAAGNIVQLVA